jgi:hypothetical protein
VLWRAAGARLVRSWRPCPARPPARHSVALLCGAPGTARPLAWTPARPARSSPPPRTARPLARSHGLWRPPRVLHSLARPGAVHRAQARPGARCPRCSPGVARHAQVRPRPGAVPTLGARFARPWPARPARRAVGRRGPRPWCPWHARSALTRVRRARLPLDALVYPPANPVR